MRCTRDVYQWSKVGWGDVEDATSAFHLDKVDEYSL